MHAFSLRIYHLVRVWLFVCFIFRLLSWIEGADNFTVEIVAWISWRRKNSWSMFIRVFSLLHFKMDWGVCLYMFLVLYQFMPRFEHDCCSINSCTTQTTTFCPTDDLQLGDVFKKPICPIIQQNVQFLICSAMILTLILALSPLHSVFVRFFPYCYSVFVFAQ